MRLPRRPQGLVYVGLVAAILFVALDRRERADAPAARMQPAAAQVETAAGTAFSVGDRGVWLTARHVVDGCGQPAVIVAKGRGVAARLLGSHGDVAVLGTDGGAPALALAPAPGPGVGQLAFAPGFPQGRPGETAARLIGPRTLRGRGRGQRAQLLLAWAEVGRTDGLTGTLAGLSGAPLLDAEGRVMSVALAWSPRRGRIYSSTSQDMRAALASAGLAAGRGARSGPVGADDYGRVADRLRRDLRVAQVVCLAT